MLRKFQAIQQVADRVVHHGEVTMESILGFSGMEYHEEILDFAHCSRRAAEAILALMEAEMKEDTLYDKCTSWFQESCRIMGIAQQLAYCQTERRGFHTAASEIIWRTRRVEALFLLQRLQSI